MLLGAEPLGLRALADAPAYEAALPEVPDVCLLSLALRTPDGAGISGATVHVEPLRRFVGGWYVGDLGLSTTTDSAGVAVLTLLASDGPVDFAWRVQAFSEGVLVLDQEAATPAGAQVLRAVARQPQLH